MSKKYSLEDIQYTIQALDLSKSHLNYFLSIGKDYTPKSFVIFYSGIITILTAVQEDFANNHTSDEEVKILNSLIEYCLAEITQSNNLFKNTNFYSNSLSNEDRMKILNDFMETKEININ
jgi:hypothetical protein